LSVVPPGHGKCMAQAKAIDKSALQFLMTLLSRLNKLTQDGFKLNRV
jgi:hypothetical protein